MNSLLKIYDTNCWYTMEIDKTQWLEKGSNKSEDCIAFELNTCDCGETMPADAKIPEETTFVMSMEDAKYMKAFLEVALDNS